MVRPLTAARVTWVRSSHSESLDYKLNSSTLAMKRKLPGEYRTSRAVPCAHHNHLLCEVHTNGSNFGHESSVFGFRLNTQTQSWHSMPCGGTAPETGASFVFGSSDRAAVTCASSSHTLATLRNWTANCCIYTGSLRALIARSRLQRAEPVRRDRPGTPSRPLVLVSKPGHDITLFSLRQTA